MTAEVVTPVPTGHRRSRFAVMTVALSLALVVVIVLSLGLGQYALSPAQVVGPSASTRRGRRTLRPRRG